MSYLPQQMKRLLVAVAAGAMMLGLQACQTQGPKKVETNLVWPPSDQGRYFWEQTLRSSSDIVEETSAEKLRRIATGETMGGRALEKPYGIVAYDGYVFIGDTVSRRIRAFDMRGKRYYEFGDKGIGTLAKPLDLAVGNNLLYVCDISGRRVVVFDFEGNYKLSIGDNELLERPSGVAVSPDGSKVYVVDTGGVGSDKHRVVVFDARDGKHLGFIGKRGNGPGEFNLPIGAAFGPDGLLYVVDGGNFRVQVLDANGKFVRAFGAVGRQSGNFARPKGIAVDPESNVYVTDSSFANFQVFNKDGQLLLDVGSRGEDGGAGQFMLPAGIAVDPTDSRVYVVDQFFRKVDVFRSWKTPEGPRKPRASQQVKK